MTRVGARLGPSRVALVLPALLLLASGCVDEVEGPPHPGNDGGDHDADGLDAALSDAGAPDDLGSGPLDRCARPADPHAGRILHVAAGAAPGGDGSAASPFASVLAAWQAASPGDILELADGEYGAETAYTRLTGETSSMGAGQRSDVWPFKHDITIRAARRFGAKFVGSVLAAFTPATRDMLHGQPTEGVLVHPHDPGTRFEAAWVYEQTGEDTVDTGPSIPGLPTSPTGPRRNWSSRVSAWYAAYEASRGRPSTPAVPPTFDLAAATVSHPLFRELVPAGVDAATFWTGTHVALYGWNNDVLVRRIRDVDAGGGSVSLEGGALPACSAADIGAGRCLRALVPVGHPAFLDVPGTFAIQADRLFHRPRAMTNPLRLPHHAWGYVGNGSRGVRLEGLWFTEYDTAIAAPSTSATVPAPDGLVITDCRVSDVRGIGISLVGTRALLTRSLVEQTGDRGISVTADDSAVTCSFVREWAERTGLFGSGTTGLTVAFNSLFTLDAQHGNGMAFYAGCQDLHIAHNLVVTPSNLALALADTGVGIVIEDNVFRGGVDWRGSVDEGARYEHNLGGITFYATGSSDDGWWKRVFGRVVRDNVLYAMIPQFATNEPGAIPSPSPYPTTPAPAGNDGYFASWPAADGIPIQHANVLARSPGAANFDADATRTFCFSERSFDPNGEITRDLYARLFPNHERYDFTLAAGMLTGSDACGPTAIDPTTFGTDGGPVGLDPSVWTRFPRDAPDAPVPTTGEPTSWYLWNAPEGR